MSLLVCGVSVCVQVQNVCTVHAAAKCIVFVYVFTFPLTRDYSYYVPRSMNNLCFNFALLATFMCASTQVCIYFT